MGTSKSALFESTDQELAQVAKALAHPARVAIIRFLLEKKTCICGDLVDELPLAQSTITQHLKELKAIGLIQGEIEGPKVNYCINSEAWERSRALLADFFASYVPSQTCC